MSKDFHNDAIWAEVLVWTLFGILVVGLLAMAWIGAHAGVWQ
jgi:hypothetical protein